MFTHILDGAGSTPIVALRPTGLEHIDLRAKLEMFNPTGSVKDRAAVYVIDRLLDDGRIDRGTMVIESSSGNFGIALAASCRRRGVPFTCVVDPKITAVNEALLRGLGANVIKVTDADANGCFLHARLRTVQELVARHDRAYWVNQYANPLNARAYYETLGREICDAVERLDYLMMGVSSCGTITGVSRRVRERFPNACVIAVDAAGSVIFGGSPGRRRIPGIGSSMVPAILAEASIDEHVSIDDAGAVRGCRELLAEHGILAGGSSGAVFAAVRRRFAAHRGAERPVVVTVFADRGERYMDTIFNPRWCADVLGETGVP